MGAVILYSRARAHVCVCGGMGGWMRGWARGVATSPACADERVATARCLTDERVQVCIAGGRRSWRSLLNEVLGERRLGCDAARDAQALTERVQVCHTLALVVP